MRRERGIPWVALSLIVVTCGVPAHATPAAPTVVQSTATPIHNTLSTATGIAPARASAPAAQDSIGQGDLLQVPQLDALLNGPAEKRPVLLHVGFKVLYRSGHIPDSRYVGPASKPAGIAAMKKALQPLSRQTPVVLYCGCCPWQDCPNVRPAFRTAREMGFKDVKVLFIAKNLQADWIDHKLPYREGD
jgi:thiosulfate/3-mercaptopyruvate sulfurtransferase